MSFLEGCELQKKHIRMPKAKKNPNTYQKYIFSAEITFWQTKETEDGDVMGLPTSKALPGS